MTRDDGPTNSGRGVNLDRRRLLGLAGAGLAFGGFMTTAMNRSNAATPATVRWGVVGTGGIANRMAPMIQRAPAAELAAVSSRRLATAEEFASEFGVARAFDDWEAMLAWDGVDAIYVATPTSVREDISVAAAEAGKHVLAEKPFASLDSIRRITRACRDNGVAFMDGTHFVHHPRTFAIRDRVASQLGWPWSLDSAFQFSLPDRGNIRYDTTLEPMGALGDAGWYNMRAIVEYLEPDVALEFVEVYGRRDTETNALASASGVLRFADGSTSTFNCGFDSGALVMDLRLTGAGGVISLSDFVLTPSPDSADFVFRQGGFEPGQTISVPSPLPAAAQQFENFAAAVADPAAREQWMQASERTQALLDAAWQASLRHANPTCDE